VSQAGMNMSARLNHNAFASSEKSGMDRVGVAKDWQEKMQHLLRQICDL
jgi:hypothetical protein